MSTSSTIPWVQCSTQPINLTPFTPPINLTVKSSVTGSSPEVLATGTSQPVFAYVVPPDLPTGAFLTLDISDATKSLQWTAATITSDGDSNEDPFGDTGEGSCNVHPTPAGGATVAGGGNIINWPQCSTQEFDLTAYSLPVNLSVSAGGVQSRVGTNVNSRVFPITVAYVTGINATVYIDDSAGLHLAFSAISIVDGTDTSCLTAASSTTSSAMSSTFASISASSARSTPSTADAASAHNTPTAAIAGGAAGGAAAIAILSSVSLFCWWKRRQRRRNRAVEIDPAFGAEGGDEDAGDLPSYTDIVSPTPLARSLSESGRSPTPLEDTSTSSNPRFSGKFGGREKSPTRSYSSYASYPTRHSRADSGTVLLSPASPISTLMMRAHNPDPATTLDTVPDISEIPHYSDSVELS